MRVSIVTAALFLSCFICVMARADIIDTKLVSNGGKGRGHQGVTKGSGTVWYVFDTRMIFRYESDDFSVDQKTLIRNENALKHPDFEGTELDHLGAPEYHDGNVYTFVKKGAYPPMRLIWFDANDLSYKAGSYRDITIPTGSDGTEYRICGGPHIVGEFFYAGILTIAEKKVISIGKFEFPSAKFVEFIPLSKPCERPQGIDMDAQGNFYAVSGSNGVYIYDPTGAYKGVLFKDPQGGFHEGCYFDAVNGKLTIAITVWETTRAGHWITKADGDDLNLPDKSPSAPKE